MMEQDRITPSARKTIEEADDLMVSSISIWEIAVGSPKRKLKLPFSPEELVYHLKPVRILKNHPVDEMIWIKNVNLDWDHQDPADRTIVATAELFGVPLVSNDEAIRAYYPKTVW